MAISPSEATELWRHPLVVVPGFMSDARVWEPQVRLLSRHLPVIVAPLRGADRVEDVAMDLLGSLPPRFTVFGADLGGSVAMAMLEQAPERIAGIGLIAASPLPETPAQAAEREAWIVRARAERIRAAMQEACPITALAPGSPRAEIMTALADMAEDLGPQLFVEQSRMMQRRGDLQTVLRRAEQPALLVCGCHDTVVPLKRQLFTAELMRNARIEMLEDAGHQPLLEQPERVSAILYNWIMQGEVSRRDHQAAPQRRVLLSPQGTEQQGMVKTVRRRFSRPMFQMVGEMQEETVPFLSEQSPPVKFESIRRGKAGVEAGYRHTG